MELNTTHGNANPTDKQSSNSNNLIEQKQVDGTPFTAVRVNEDWFLTLGKYRLTDKLKTLGECIEEAKDASWWRIMQIMNIMIQEHEENKTLERTKQVLQGQLDLNGKTPKNIKQVIN